MAKSFKRTDRVSAQLRRDVGELVHAVVRDHGLPSVSVSDVEVSRDLAYAKVWLTALEPERGRASVAALNANAANLRFDLGRRLRMRNTPQLRFFYDDSMDQGERIDQLLRDAGAVEDDS